ncbi:hypothetical protein [Desmospora activa]|uniref:Uncharacterized protein n=1 Tax=Desmospora activa DSM 45169 TaxID=1121389 RepID=A0A2T4ZCU6_9BACL|nr:hypothetical protein [Desmospora activa]PTM59703.1 hypothetical protein C8J48_2333 [Desmospora activa DSM 45169]
MSQSGPSKKDFADLINQVLGRNVMNEQVMDRLLQNARKNYQQQGMNGIFEMVRQMTQAPIDNKEMKAMMDTILGSSSPGDALDRLGGQNWLSEGKARQLKRHLETPTKRKKGG